MVFLRLRKAWRKNKTAVYGIAPYASRGLTKVGGALIQAAPGTETEVLHALRERRAELEGPASAIVEGTIFLVGERLGTVPGALSAVAMLAKTNGARIAWIPRRAGERGALEAGCLPDLLPGGRPAREPQARSDLQALWGVDHLPAPGGRDAAAIVRAAAGGQLAGLVIGGVEVSDLPDQPVVAQALERAFVVSLEVRDSIATESADVVLPVAPVAEKSGAFLNWEGRVTPFTAALATTAMGDHRVLDLLAAEMGISLNARSVDEIRAELGGLQPWSGRHLATPTADSRPVPSLAPGQAVLATWHQLLDAGRMQDGEPYLAGTAPLAVARLSAATAGLLDIVDGMAVTVSTPAGSITLPAQITPMVDHVVWLPTNSAGSRVRATLGVDAGDVVTVTKGGAA